MTTETKPIRFFMIPDALAKIEERIEIDEETGEVHGDLNDLVEQFKLQNLAEDGILWYAKVNPELEANTLAIELEIAEIQESLSQVAAPYVDRISFLVKQKAAIANRQEWNKVLVLNLMKALGVDTVLDAKGKKISIVRTKQVDPHGTVTDEILDTLDPKFVRMKKSLDKNAVEAVAKAGEWTSGDKVPIIENESVRFPK